MAACRLLLVALTQRLLTLHFLKGEREIEQPGIWRVLLPPSPLLLFSRGCGRSIRQSWARSNTLPPWRVGLSCIACLQPSSAHPPRVLGGGAFWKSRLESRARMVGLHCHKNRRAYFLSLCYVKIQGKAFYGKRADQNPTKPIPLSQTPTSKTMRSTQNCQLPKATQSMIVCDGSVDRPRNECSSLCLW